MGIEEGFLEIDLDNVPDPVLFEDGSVHQFTVKHAELVETKAGDPMFVFRLECQDEAEADTTFHQIAITPGNELLARRDLKDMCLGFGYPYQGTGKVEAAGFVGLTGSCKMEQESYKGQLRNNVKSVVYQR